MSVQPVRRKKMALQRRTGFCKLRFCEDQILRITQTNSDGIQAAKPQRSPMALLDLSKASDRVWREERLLAASFKGLPIPFVCWLGDFITNRSAWVQINGDRGYSAPLRQGLPQGVVLSPIHRQPALRCVEDGRGGTLRR